MARLEGKNAVVGGGTGRVGEGLVRAFLLEGAQVIVPVRSDAKEQKLRSYVSDVTSGGLFCYPAQLGDDGSVQELRKKILDEFKRVDLAVACLGGWYYGHPLHHMPFDDWRTVLHDNLDTHFLFMKNILSILHDQNEGLFVMINGSPSEMVIPEEGASSIVAAAQSMMSRVLAQEAKTTRVRVHSVAVYNPVRTRDRDGMVMPDWPTAEDLGDYIVKMFTGEAPNLDQTIHKIYAVDDI